MQEILFSPERNPIRDNICARLSLRDIQSLRVLNPKLDCSLEIMDEYGVRHTFSSLTPENLTEYQQIRRSLGLTLIRMAYGGRTEAVLELLKRKDIDLQAQDYGGNTAVFWAAANNYLHILQALLKRKEVPVNLKNSCGLTALNIATIYHHTDIVQELLKRPDLDSR